MYSRIVRPAIAPSVVTDPDGTYIGKWIVIKGAVSPVPPRRRVGSAIASRRLRSRNRPAQILGTEYYAQVTRLSV
jgi:hypothetical protein